MNSTSSFWVSKKGWITLAKVNWCGGFIERVKIGETVDDLCQPLMFTTTLPAKPDSSVFFPLCHLWLCGRKDEIVQNPEWTQPKLFPHGEPWGRRLVWPHLYIFPWFVEWRSMELYPSQKLAQPKLVFLLYNWDSIDSWYLEPFRKVEKSPSY